MWERSLNRKAQAKPAWFVLPGSAGENPLYEGSIKKGKIGGSLERKERDVVASSNENKNMRQGLGKGAEKNAAKVWSFTKPGGGVTEDNKKPNPFFGKVFFQ